MAVSDCGVGALVNNTVLAWDRDKFQATPTWADFWDVAKIPGNAGCEKRPRRAASSRCWPTAWRRAMSIRPWRRRRRRSRVSQARSIEALYRLVATSAEAAKILGSGDVLMTTTPSSVIATANRVDKRNFGIQFAGQSL